LFSFTDQAGSVFVIVGLFWNRHPKNSRWHFEHFHDSSRFHAPHDGHFFESVVRSSAISHLHPSAPGTFTDARTRGRGVSIVLGFTLAVLEVAPVVRGLALGAALEVALSGEEESETR
jgi:hypothetical protein